MSLSTIAGYCALMALSAVAVFWLCGRAARFALSWSRRRAMRALIRERQSAFLPPNPAREEAKRALGEPPHVHSGEPSAIDSDPRAWGCQECSEMRADRTMARITTTAGTSAVPAGFTVVSDDAAAVDGLLYLSDWASGTVTASNGTTSTTLTGAGPPFEVSPIAYLYPRVCSAMGCGEPHTPCSVYRETHARAAERST